MEPFDSTLGMLRWIGFAQRKAAEVWVRDRGLSMEQAFTLGYLDRFPGAMQREIADMSRTSAASVSSLLQGLERRGLVERRSKPGDERSKRVYATASAVELTSGFEDAMAAADETILAPLDADERAALHGLLTKITAELPEPTRPEPTRPEGARPGPTRP